MPPPRHRKPLNKSRPISAADAPRTPAASWGPLVTAAPGTPFRPPSTSSSPTRSSHRVHHLRTANQTTNSDPTRCAARLVADVAHADDRAGPRALPLLWSILISFQRLRLIQVGTADLFQPLTLANYKRVLGSGTPSGPASRPRSSTPPARSSSPSDSVCWRRSPYARPVPRADLRPGGVPAALRRAGGGGHLHLADDAQSAVRHHQRDRPVGVRLGRADRLPLPGRGT